MDTEKSISVYSRKFVCKYNIFDWRTHRFLCVGTGFSCVRMCQEFFFKLRKLLFE